MPVGCIHSVALMVIEVDIREVSGAQYLRPRCPPAGTPVMWAVLDDLSEWECLPVEWWSPLHELIASDTLRASMAFGRRYVALRDCFFKMRHGGASSSFL